MREVNRIQDLRDLVGQEIGVSEWETIDQCRIDKFADVTGDHQWIHVDVERAQRDLSGGSTIAHGLLCLSLLPKLMNQILHIGSVRSKLNYGYNRIRFTNMVPEGSRIRARQVLKAVEPFKGDGFQVINEVTLEIEGQSRPACIAETMTIIYP